MSYPCSSFKEVIAVRLCPYLLEIGSPVSRFSSSRTLFGKYGFLYFVSKMLCTTVIENTSWKENLMNMSEYDLSAWRHKYDICMTMPECALINKALNMSWVLNMPQIWIWQSPKFGRAISIQALDSVLNMPEENVSAEFWIYLGF